MIEFATLQTLSHIIGSVEVFTMEIGYYANTNPPSRKKAGSCSQSIKKWVLEEPRVAEEPFPAGNKT